VNLTTPDGLALRPYQEEGAHWLIKNRATLLADEPGTGKTVQVAAALNAANPGSTAFIGCPETLMLNWMRELSKWMTRPVSVGLATAKHVPDTEIVIANYDIFPQLIPHFWQRSYNVAVLDEAHRIKSPDAKRTQAAGYINAWHRWALTGTPILNRPIEAWAVLWWLLRDQVMPYGEYARRFCNAHLRTQWVKRYGKAIQRKVWDMSGATNLDELRGYLLGEAHMLRRRKEDVLQDLPPKTHQVIELNAERVRKLIKNESRAVSHIGGYEAALAKLEAGEKIAFEAWTDTRHELGLAKMGPCLEFIQDAMQEEQKIVVFCHHRDVLAGLVDELKAYNPVCVWGGLSAPQTDAAVQAFQNDPSVRVFVGNDAACEGLTLTAAKRCIFVELDPVPGRMIQFEDRLHRIGQRDNVLVQALVFEGSLDMHLIKMLWTKSKITSRAVDGRAN
jgi:SWI/SNF-related matrix-associated actin-dependent regulator of chromatin subfamily A-like protein 1